LSYVGTTFHGPTGRAKVYESRDRKVKENPRRTRYLMLCFVQRFYIMSPCTQKSNPPSDFHLHPKGAILCESNLLECCVLKLPDALP
jgi:hypothetical protein